MQANDLVANRILQDMSEGVLCSRKGRIHFINPAAAEILGMEKEYLLGKSLVQAFCAHKENDAFTQALLDAIYNHNATHEQIVPYFDGHRLQHLHLKTSFLREDNSKLGLIAVFNDVSELLALRGTVIDMERLKELNAQLENRNQRLAMARDRYKSEARTDKLTGLLNKGALEEACRESLSLFTSNDQGFLYIIDLDHFKEVNDTYGHQAGDEILRQFAAALTQVFPAGAFIGRFGGDEFVVWCVALTDAAAAEEKAARLLQAAKELTIPGKEIFVTASIGLARFPTDGAGYEELFAAADRAVYAVKAAGRAGYRSADSRSEHTSPAG